MSWSLSRSNNTSPQEPRHTSQHTGHGFANWLATVLSVHAALSVTTLVALPSVWA